MSSLADFEPDNASESPLPVIPLSDPAEEGWQERLGPPLAETARQRPSRSDVLFCACPECRAPMSVRMSLGVARCWRCQAFVEASRELLEGEQDEPSVAGQPAPALSSARIPEMAIATPVRSEPAPPPTVEPPVAEPPVAVRSLFDYADLAPDRHLRWLNDRLRETPAWVISLVLHLILLTVLSMLTMGDADQPPLITLSTEVSVDKREGGRDQPQDPQAEVIFDLPLPKEVNLTDEKQRRALVLADQEARELRLDPNAQPPHLPDLWRVKRQLGADDVAARTLAARDPRLRVEMVEREGGTTLTEAAVARGLRWLAMHQNEDGRWSLDRFHEPNRCNCSGRGGIRSDSAATSLALLPFLGAGQTHLTGRYKDTVSGGLRWLIAQQRGDGDLAAGADNNAKMYAHGQGAIVLCEAYAMTWDESLREPAQRAINFIVAAQHSGGGWRYRPGQEGDTSVLGWQLMALQSARAAGLSVPEETLENAGHYLDRAQHSDGARYAYMPGNNYSNVMTAEAILCRMYLGWTKDYPDLEQSVSFLTRPENLPSPSRPNIYYWYYGAQAMHHWGGSPWEQWNHRLRDILVNMQETSGHAAGSWAPRGEHSSAGGRLYMTALAVCTLEVYYRHAPIFRQIDLK